jgi:hypothetical protein
LQQDPEIILLQCATVAGLKFSTKTRFEIPRWFFHIR